VARQAAEVRPARRPAARAAVEDPENGDDIVSMGLVDDVAISDGTAEVSLAFNAPHAPAEMEIGDAVREAIEEA
ncbi:iron-sulfur cluster assembly protein, partial [Halorubrum sp. SP9]|uniref:iron-sulfur cluster assembly protein n=1 Tax=Halorubrum sp. SP9 TaxID=1537267 RepID=UPI0010FA12E0